MAVTRKILIIEDEKDLAKVLSDTLKEEKYSVEIAYDGEEALEKARKICPDLVILDLMIPKVDGYKVCEIIKTDSRLQRTEIIVLSARDSDIEAKAAFASGADEYITKPYKASVLLESVRSRLKK